MKILAPLIVAFICLLTFSGQAHSKSSTENHADKTDSKTKFAIGNVRANVCLLRSDQIPFSDILNDNKVRERLEYLLSRENPIQSTKESSLRTAIETALDQSRIDLDTMLDLSQEYQDSDRLFQSYQCIAVVVSCLQSSAANSANSKTLQGDMETLAKGAYSHCIDAADVCIRERHYDDAVVSLNYAARLSDNPTVIEKIDWTLLTKRMVHILPLVSTSQKVLLNNYIAHLNKIDTK